MISGGVDVESIAVNLERATESAWGALTGGFGFLASKAIDLSIKAKQATAKAIEATIDPAAIDSISASLTMAADAIKESGKHAVTAITATLDAGSTTNINNTNINNNNTNVNNNTNNNNTSVNNTNNNNAINATNSNNESNRQEEQQEAPANVPPPVTDWDAEEENWE